MTMRLLEIAKKDILHTCRSLFILVFALGLPLLTTGVFYAAFGGFASGDAPAVAAPAKVIVANLDSQGAAGVALADALQSPAMAGVLAVTAAKTESEARAAVDTRSADAAVVIPAGFTAELYDPAGKAVVEIYQDPALTVGPAITLAVVHGVLDGFSGARIAAQTYAEILAARGIPIDPAAVTQVAADYAGWAGGGIDAGGWNLQPLGAEAPAAENSTARMLQAIMGMMLVFYCFFTGASAAQSILQEQEAGTLQRLFTTATPRSVILGGKLLAVLVILLIQVGFLTAVAALVFGIHWGAPVSVILAVLGTSALSAGFAIFLVSLLRNTKQAGMVYGVVVNLVGWVGISRMFADIIPGLAQYAPVMNAVSLISPQGWAARIWQESLAGAPNGFAFVCMLAISAALFAFGVYRFNRRFAI
jgi:ABC-2 type transport system permease protein